MESNSSQDILEKAEKYRRYIVEVRRHLHERPESSFQEYETSRFISKQLKEIGLVVTEGIATTGVVGFLKGGHPGKTVALRADMDALPIIEESNFPTKSLREGLMHACGHDAHMSMLLGSAQILVQYQGTLKGNIKFIFQPAEEIAPDGGAKEMIAQGVLENPKVASIFGLHVWPDLPAGELGVRTGNLMAANDIFRLVIKGKGGHGAIPDQAINPIYLASQVLIASKTIIDQGADPFEPALISITVFRAGTTYNILPDQAVLEGTVRYHDPKIGLLIKDKLEHVASSICQSSGGLSVLEYHYGFPPLINDKKMTALSVEAAVDILGDENVHSQVLPSMASEDFARYLQTVPGCYFWLGTKNLDKGIVHPLHSAKFQVDEDILPLGAAILANIAIKFLGLAKN